MRKLYKVLENGASCNGGSLEWSLPTQSDRGEWQPGDWHEVTGPLVLCEHGLHLTWDPAQWFAADREVYECEAEGLGAECDGDAKVVCRRARLTRRLSDDELAEVRIYRYGEHEVHGQICWAHGSATVRAYDSATVRAYGSATVEAYDLATVRAHGSATVEAYDLATVRARGSATVRAYDSATVRACDSATVVAHWGSATVAVHDRAVFVDQRGTAPRVEVAQ